MSVKKIDRELIKETRDAFLIVKYNMIALGDDWNIRLSDGCDTEFWLDEDVVILCDRTLQEEL